MPWSPPQVVLPQYRPDRLSWGGREARSMCGFYEMLEACGSINRICEGVPSPQLIFPSQYYFVLRRLRKATPPRQRKQISDMSLSSAIMILKF